MEKKFNYQYDFIRILSALAVLTIHVTSIHIVNNSYAYVLNQLARFCVPMFILLAGLVTPALDRKFHLATFYIKKIFNILIPYILALSFYLLFEIFTTGSTFEIMFFIKRIIHMFMKGYSHLYFLSIILQLYLLYPLIRYLLIKNDKVILMTSFLVSLYFQSAIFLIETKGIALLPFFGRVPYYITFPLYLFYFVLGVYIKKNPITIKTDSFNINILWLFSFVILLLESIVTNTAGLSIKPTVILYTISTFLFLCNLYEELNLNKYSDKLRYLSGLTFGFYIIHIFVLRLTWKYLFINSFWNSIEGIILGIIINTIITSAIVMLYYKIKQYILTYLKVKKEQKSLIIN